MGGIAEATLSMSDSFHERPWPQGVMLLFPLALGFVAARVAGRRPRFVAGVVGAAVTPLALVWFILGNHDWSMPYMDWSIGRIALQMPVAVLGGH
jgi:hypothetical protein